MTDEQKPPEAAGPLQYAGMDELPPHPGEDNLPPLPGPEGDEDPITQKWRGENWEHDVNKAHVMALAGHDIRSSAAEHRALYESRKKQFYQGSEPESYSDTAWIKKKSEEEDKIAGRLEYWAGVLHDHPLGQAFLQAWNDRFAGEMPSAEELVMIEEARDEDTDKTFDLIGEALSTEKFDENTLAQLLDKMNNIDSTLESGWPEYRELKQSKEATLGQLAELYKNHCLEHARDMLGFAQESMLLLRAIESGWAGSPDYKKPEVPGTLPSELAPAS